MVCFLAYHLATAVLDLFDSVVDHEPFGWFQWRWVQTTVAPWVVREALLCAALLMGLATRSKWLGWLRCTARGSITQRAASAALAGLGLHFFLLALNFSLQGLFLHQASGEGWFVWSRVEWLDLCAAALYLVSGILLAAGARSRWSWLTRWFDTDRVRINSSGSAR